MYHQVMRFFSVNQVVLTITCERHKIFIVSNFKVIIRLSSHFSAKPLIFITDMKREGNSDIPISSSKDNHRILEILLIIYLQTF